MFILTTTVPVATNELWEANYPTPKGSVADNSYSNKYSVAVSLYLFYFVFDFLNKLYA